MKEYRANNALALAIRAIFLGMPLAVCSMTTTSIYAATEHNISIAKKSLDQALTELAIQSGNDTNSSSDRSSLQKEVSALQGQITNTLSNTEWNGMKTLKGGAGNAGTVSFHVGASTADAFTVDMTSLDTGALANAQTSVSINIATRSGATNALSTINDALTQIDKARTQWGATANRLVYAADNATNVSMNTSASRSRIMDADYAQTTADLARAMILDQAGAAMLTQANQKPMYVLALLQ